MNNQTEEILTMQSPDFDPGQPCVKAGTPQEGNVGNPHPYAEGALIYFRKGWTDVFPVGTNAHPYAKEPVPVGVTGYDGKPVGWRRIRAAVDAPAGRRNLGLRMPRHIICMDVDGYDGKEGLDTLAAMVADLGPLPDTFRNTARGIENSSGHRYYRLPVGMCARPAAEEDIARRYGPHIEILHRCRRYAVAWPSVHLGTGTRYYWYTPAGLRMSEPPAVVDIPLLPDAWLPLFAASPDSPEAAPRGGNLRGAKAGKAEDPEDDLFDAPGPLIRRSVAEIRTADQLRAVLTMQAGTVNKTLGGAAIWFARMADAGLFTLDQARTLVVSAARKNGVHSDDWNRANRKRWTLNSRVADGLSQGLNRERYLILDDCAPTNVFEQMTREIER